ncbi:MAG: hypothetical protein KF752_11985 [Pirellulaceae bacterium]|nr:hypothetical protein [Pirellulaceae bacterium]
MERSSQIRLGFPSRLSIGIRVQALCIWSLTVLGPLTGYVALAAEPSGEMRISRRQRLEAASSSIPLGQLQEHHAAEVRDVVNNPSFYRQMPPRMMNCDPQLLTYLIRRPEVMVNIWEMIGITNIQAQRTGTNTFYANDGAGTTCNCELIHSSDSVHIYYGTGNYEGILAPRPITGRVVCVVHSRPQPNPQAHSGFLVQGTMDVFMKVDNLGADLLTRTLGPLVGKVTEHNYDETSRFVCQLSEFCAANPGASQQIAGQLSVRDETAGREFSQIAARIAMRKHALRSNPQQPSRLAQQPSQSSQPEIVVFSDQPGEALRTLGQVRLATLPDLELQAATDDADSSGNYAEVLQPAELAASRPVPTDQDSTQAAGAGNFQRQSDLRPSKPGPKPRR